MRDYFKLYDALLDSMGTDAAVHEIREALSGRCWAMAATEDHFGMAISETCASRPALFPAGLVGHSLPDGAGAVRSWNLAEASVGLAAMNAYFNTPERMNTLGCAEPYENYCTANLSFVGMTVGVIGHMHLTPEIHREAKEIYIIERRPQPGDYPDSACDVLLPRCDAVFITGSTLVNKTLPHLLALCPHAYTILTGPSVPMCPALLEFGIDRLAGLVVTERAAMRERIVGGIGGNPYPLGQSFLLKK